LKDLRNQAKRLVNTLSDEILFQLENQKKKTFKNSEVPKGDIDSLLDGLETANTLQK
jgi:hypothetical protein